MGKEEFPSSLVAISTEALSGLPSCFEGRLVPPAVKKELVVASPEEIGDDVDWERISGVHYRTEKKENFFQDCEMIMAKVVGKAKYVTIHLENLRKLSSENLEEKLIELNERAQDAGVFLLLENVTPLVDDTDLGSEFRSVFAFEKKHGEVLNRLQNIGYCLDIAHLGLAEPHVLRVWERVFESRLSGVKNLSQILSDEELEIWELTQSVISRTKTIHWSRARERRKPVDQGVIFRTARFLAQSFPQGMLGSISERIHNLYTKAENVSGAHLSLISNPNMFSMILAVLEELNWQGEIVLESPIRFKIIPKPIREGRIDTMNEFYALQEWNYGVRKRILEKTFRENRIFSNDLTDLLSFPFPEGLESLSPKFFPLLLRIFPLLVETYPLDVRRKVNKGLYLRHPLQAGVWGDQLFEEWVRRGFLKENDREVFYAATYLHDALEIRAINRQDFKRRLEDLYGKERAKRVINAVLVLTPEIESKPSSSKEYQEQKRRDFQMAIREWQLGDKVPLLVKINDMLALLDETIDDLRNGRENGQMRPLLHRYLVWKERIGIISNLLGKKSPVVSLLRERLSTIEDDLKWNLNERINLSQEARVLIEKMREERGFSFQWRGSVGFRRVDGIVVINDKACLVKRVNGNTVEMIFLDDLAEWIKNNYSEESVPPLIILCRERGKWTNIPFSQRVMRGDIEIDESSFFGKRLSAIALDSGDLSFPA